MLTCSFIVQVESSILNQKFSSWQIKPHVVPNNRSSLQTRLDQTHDGMLTCFSIVHVPSPVLAQKFHSCNIRPQVRSNRRPDKTRQQKSNWSTPNPFYNRMKAFLWVKSSTGKYSIGKLNIRTIVGVDFLWLFSVLIDIFY